ncbi:MAG: hypothetical protein QY311_02540 [Candidatus Paceibacterota bacterium]|nr:MAG: hypothetical protein QY311_02540 [Candidatus Paceibacterota bacterium]
MSMKMTREEQEMLRQMFAEVATVFLECDGIREGEPASVFIPDASCVKVFVLEVLRQELAEAGLEVEVKEWPYDASPTFLEISKAPMLEN